MKHKTRSQLFLEVSALLTGFSETELLATGMAEPYFAAILKDSPTDSVEYFFIDLAKLLDGSHTPETVHQVLSTGFMPDSSYGGLTKKIIILWYTGYWNNNVLSADSYIQALMWPAGHSHPPGAKQPGYGSWANLPLSVTSNQQENPSQHGK